MQRLVVSHKSYAKNNKDKIKIASCDTNCQIKIVDISSSSNKTLEIKTSCGNGSNRRIYCRSNRTYNFYFVFYSSDKFLTFVTKTT